MEPASPSLSWGRYSWGHADPILWILAHRLVCPTALGTLQAWD